MPPALRILVAALLAVGLGYALAFLPGGAPAVAPWLLLVGTVTSLLVVARLGMARRASRAAGAALAVVFVMVVAGVGGALLLADPVAGDPLFGGLPAGAALVVYGAGLLPLLVVPLAYAWSFDEAGFAPGELEELVERARRAAEEAP